MGDWQRSNRKNKRYKLEPYSKQWVEDFAVLKNQISPLYGKNLLDFHHIGSTSVPGMLAKAQIDVCAVVADIEKVKDVRTAFEELGYEAKGDYVGQGEEYFTFTDADGQRKYNIHTLQQGDPAVEGYLSFRDYLTAFPEAMQKCPIF